MENPEYWTYERNRELERKVDELFERTDANYFRILNRILNDVRNKETDQVNQQEVQGPSDRQD